MEEFGYCNQSVVPVRASATHTSEMVNQLLFGETFDVLDKSGDFVRIRGTADKYEGFIHQKQFVPVTGETIALLNSKMNQFSAEPVSEITETKSGITFPVLIGSNLTGFENGSFQVGSFEYRFSGRIQQPEMPAGPDKLADTARRFLGAPYLWGGRSLFGIDCSGLVQVVFMMHGITIQRDASYQAQAGEMVNLSSEAIAGDLAFFDDDEGQIVHVGMLTGNRQIIHASGHVRMDDFDHQGIYNHQLKKYTHKLRVIKRLI